MTTTNETTSLPARSGNWRTWLIGIAISLLAIYFVLSQLDLAVLADALRDARYIYAVPSAALLLVGLYTRALRWRVLLQNALPPMRAFHILNVSYLANGVLPLRLGEVARAYLASRAEPSVSIPRALSTIVVERLIDVIAVLILLVLAASAALPPALGAAALAVAPLAVGGLIVLVIMASNKARALRWVEALSGRIPLLQRIQAVKLAGDVLEGFAVLTNPAACARVIGWSAAGWFCSVAAGYILMLAFYPTADWAASCLFVAAASLAIALPAVPGNIGTYEASVLLALSVFPAYAQPLETGTAFAIVMHGLNLLLYAVTGAIGLWREGVSLGQLGKGETTLKRKND
jgi:uncharacterized protein (TIRG00374 family)